MGLVLNIKGFTGHLLHAHDFSMVRRGAFQQRGIHRLQNIKGGSQTLPVYCFQQSFELYVGGNTLRSTHVSLSFSTSRAWWEPDLTRYT